MALYLNILTVILLSLVAGLLLILHGLLKEWRATSKEAPLLAEKLTETILSARKGLADLKQELTQMGPELSRLTDEGSKLRVELQFLMQRGAQIADKLEGERPVVARVAPFEDDGEDMPVVRLAPATQAAVEDVASANGMAARPVMRPASAGSDPLEELLAGLQNGSDEPIRKTPAKRKRVGPITQAELDLQQSLGGGDL
ncbi:MAG: hypothetical protein DI585_03840 [Pseudomonas fluorescens]|nr:MAG: hypothetical protein DI585_03840 [Pseudomonas fluorescens]